MEFLGLGSSPGRETAVLEIGPGGGVLSAALIEAGARVLAVELDRSWAARVRARLPRESFSVWVGDALDVPWERLPSGMQVAGNLPYAISTALIEDWLGVSPKLGRAGFLVQYEVALRMLASPGSRQFGGFSALVQSRARCRLLARVRPGSFRPPPRVESAFVGLEPIQNGVSAQEWPGFKASVRAVFRQRRKSVLNSLADGSSRSEARRVLEAAGVDPGCRAETLDIEALLAIHRARRREGG